MLFRSTDIHGLGVILYELLVGRPPFQAESFVDVLDLVRRAEPTPPTALRRDIPQDLEVICLKCLEKRPEDRYLTAGDLADDLRRFLRGEPLRARPPGMLKVVGKWCRRHPGPAALAALAVFLPMIGLGLLLAHNRQLGKLAESLSKSLQESREWQRQAGEGQRVAENAARATATARDLAEESRRLAQERTGELAQLAYASSVHLADEAFRLRDIRQSRAHLETARRQAADGVPLGFEWAFLDQLLRCDHREVGQPLREFTAVTCAPRGSVVAAGGEGGDVQLIDLPSGEVRAVLHTPHDAVRGLTFDPSGARLFATGDDGTVTVWNAAEGTLLQRSP